MQQAESYLKLLMEEVGVKLMPTKELFANIWMLALRIVFNRL